MRGLTRGRVLVTALLALVATAGLALANVQNGAARDRLKPLQPIIDAAAPGDVVKLEPGIYKGSVVIDKPMTLDGRDEAIIDAEGEGSVIVLKANGATLKNLRLVNSGRSHNSIDAGVQVRGMFNTIKDSVIKNCLFGVDLQKSKYNTVRGNHIGSKPVSLGLRGDAVRLWYSFNNTIEDNVIEDSRDFVVWYSKDNTIKNNTVRDGRYGLHFMYSETNEVIGNHYERNSVGIFLMYSDGVVVRDNYIAHSVGATGIGIGFKETSDVVIEGNEILHNGRGMYLDVSPYQPDTTNRIRENAVAYNGIGILFHNDWKGNLVKENGFKGNITQVAVNGGGGANRNEWLGNHWSDYEGFDRDGDGVGDTPYELYSYSDRIWMDVPGARFFKGSPVLEVLDFLERLAPFTPAQLVVRDPKPLMSAAEVEQ